MEQYIHKIYNKAGCYAKENVSKVKKKSSLANCFNQFNLGKPVTTQIEQYWTNCINIFSPSRVEPLFTSRLMFDVHVFQDTTYLPFSWWADSLINNLLNISVLG